MIQTARRPSVEEIEQLREQTRRDPGSPAFVQLGEAYLALGRPKEALEVGSRGLQADPENNPGRLMIGRAYAMLHQWKEAQTELLRVVKADRSHAGGFLLLGEVLLRRADYERALPVLQHAYNLEPGAPGLEDMLKRARTGLPLDPPPPIPTPLDPVSSQPMPPRGMPQPAADPLAGFSDEPTRVAPTLMGGGPVPGMMPPPAAPPLAYPQGAYPPPAPPAYPQGAYPPPAPPAYPQGMYPPPAPPAYPQQSAYPPAAPPAYPQQSAYPPAMPPAAPPAPPPVAAPPPPAPAARSAAPPAPAPAAKSAAPPAPAPAPAVEAPAPGRPPNVRPRIVSMEKPRDAAKQPLRNAAAVGDYLNTLLTRGLLHVPEVQARVEDFDIKPSKRWGRSTFRTFVFLFVLLAAGIGGGGYWYYWSEQQREADVARHLDEARRHMEPATYADLTAAVESTRLALERDRQSTAAMALFARANSLLALLYGTAPEQVELALATARREITEGKPGWGDLVFAQAATTLATLPKREEAASQLADTRKTIDAWVTAHPEDAWMQWLQGQAMLAVSDLGGAARAFEAAESGGKGPVVATISRGNLLLDAGDLEGAAAAYKSALERVEKHPLAVVNEAILRIEQSGEPADIKGNLNINMPEDAGPRANAYKFLAMALVHHLYPLEDYVQLGENIDKAVDVAEPRFLARVALVRLLQGNVTAAAEKRQEIVWYSKEPVEPDPLVVLLDAELLLATGLPARAIEKLGEQKGPRARLVRGRALYELGKTEEALAELDKLLEIAPEDWEGQTWRSAAALVATRGGDRDKADEKLAELGRNLKSKIVRYAHGTAYLRMDRAADGQRRIEQSLEGVDQTTPNPLAYLAHVALAELDIKANKLPSALEHLKKATEQNPGYLPAVAMTGRIQLLQGEHDQAIESLKQVIDEPELATAALELAYAEALVARPDKVNEQARKTAREAVLRAKDKGASADELARVAAMVDEALAGELGVEGGGDKKKKSKRRRR